MFKKRASLLSSPRSHHGAEATETSQEDNKFLQIQLQLQAALSDPHRRDFQSGCPEKQDPDQGADAQIPDGRGAAVHHKVSPSTHCTFIQISQINI